MSRPKVSWLAVILFAAAVIATRLPLAPRQLFSFDDVNLAWSIGRFDIRESRPHPPGYPLFVLQMRLLDALRFKNAQSNLKALSLAGSLAALLLIMAFGNRFWGRDAGLCAALLLLLYPSFWYAGLTSALRIQLAVVSLAVAAACLRAWRGERRWVLWSAAALGLGAGVRPELGPLLLPLWAASAIRARADARQWGQALGMLTVTVLVWLIPTMISSGGPKTYFELCWKYLRDQAALTSPLLGAPQPLWQTTVCRLLVWTFVGVLAWPLSLVLLRRSKSGFAISREQWAFLALWSAPAFAFALLVHVADAGQTLAITPVVCLVGGRLMSGALDEIEAYSTRWHGLIWMLTAAAPVLALRWVSAGWALLLIPMIALAAGSLMRRGPAGTPPPRGHALAFLMAPVLFVNCLVFFHRTWYHAGTSSRTVLQFLHRCLRDLNSGLAFTSFEQVRSTTAVDHRTLQSIDRLTRGHPRLAVILWERGLTSWRKAAYYYHYWPIVVLDRKTLAGPAPPVVTIWRGAVLERRIEGPPPLRITLPRGGRLIWLLHPRADFTARLREQFRLHPFETVYFCDLPETEGSLQVGDFLFVW